MAMPQPEMMAIGDSLYNGVRSLTITRDLAKWSVPAQVADALNIPFVLPDYDRNVVVDMERWLRMFPDIPAIAKDVADNVNFWLSQPHSSAGASEFDNIAIASTTFDDMTSRTWRTAQAEIDALVAQYGDRIGSLGRQLGDLFFAFNTRFLLNPAADPAAPAETSLQIVARRKPKRLLVSIGSNNGLWSMCFDAVDGGFGPNDLAQLKTFVAALRGLPPEVEHIYVNALALPSTVSNLMPIPDYSENNKPAPGAYFANYENRFGFAYGALKGAEVAQLDTRVGQINAMIATEASADPRIHVVPLDRLLKDYDRKHSSAASVVVPSDGKTLSNVMTEAAPWPFPHFRSGGLQGLDGMHPTMVGYALAARKVLEAIQQFEGIAAPVPNIDAAYSADSLLQSVPRPWDIVLWAWRDIRRARAQPGTPQPEGLQESATEAFMDAVQFKKD
jgi:hypothetical protein